MDSLSPEKRSWNMSRIKSKDTKIEVRVRQYLFSKGFRFRKNDKRFPGKPDVVLPKACHEKTHESDLERKQKL